MKRTIWVINKYAVGRDPSFHTRTVELARKWNDRGRRVVIIASSAFAPGQFGDGKSARSDSFSNGVHTVILRTFPYFASASLRRVLSWVHFEWRLFRTQLSDLPHPDVIIVSSLSLFSVINGLRLSRKYKCPWVFEVRDIWPLTLLEEGGFHRFHPLVIAMGLLERIGYRMSHLTVGTMPNLSPHASRVAGRNISCACIPFGFHSESIDSAPKERFDFRTIVNGEDAVKVIGYAGSIGISNALDTILQCAQQLASDSRFRFVFLGDGDLKSLYQKQTRELSNVYWLDAVPRNQVRAFLERCDILYFATSKSRIWEIGMSLNKVSDYLLAKKPIIASFSGYPSIINEAGCGVIVPAEDSDALIDVLRQFAKKSQRELTAMGQSGYDWFVKNRSWNRLADEYLSFLDSLMK